MILVTGATGTLGRPTVTALERLGAEVGMLSRGTGPGLVTADLATGAGVRQAVAGASVVVHLATSRGRGDAAQTRVLLDAAEAARIPHLLYISIVGIDDIPLRYYREKLECERLITASPVPHTILRATQFHELITTIYSAQRLSPVLLAPAVLVQPIAAREVAERLAELACGSPSGRVADMGGPEVLDGRRIATLWKRATRSHRPVVPIKPFGAAFRSFARGAALTRGFDGAQTFGAFLERTAGRTAG